MGAIYSYEIWVPHSRLYEFLEQVNAISDGRMGTLLHWPDGRQLEFCGHYRSYGGTKPQELAFDTSLCADFWDEGLYNSEFYINLPCEADEVLNDETSPYSSSYSKQENNQFLLLDIDFQVHIFPKLWYWLSEEPYSALVSFTSPLHDVFHDHIFRKSPSIRKLFVDLAKHGGAISCVLDSDLINDRTFFLDGCAMDEDGLAFNHFRDLRWLLHPEIPLSENEKRLVLCRQYDELSQHDLLARIEWAQSAEDSGIRAVACQSLTRIKNGEIENLLCEIARTDNDWRVRYTSIRCLNDYNSLLSETTLFEAFHDENFEVRIAAIDTLANRTNLSRNLADELRNLLVQLPFRGPTMGVFYASMKVLASTRAEGKPYHAQIIRQRMSEPDFPFEWEAQQAIARLES